MTLGEAVRRTTERLSGAGIERPRPDAEWLVGSVAAVSRTGLHLERDRVLTQAEAEELDALVARRAAREPLAYVLGEWGFRRLTLRCDARALVPRPETEVVVDRCLALLAPLAEPRVLDVGVGSGAIALALADEHPGARVTGVDASSDALALARENAERLGLPVELREAGVDAAAEGWDLVVANPPYVREDEYERLAPELGWEPRSALVGDGLHARIARAARTRCLVLEVGDGQAASVAQSLAGAGYADIRITRDLADRQRVVEGRRP